MFPKGWLGIAIAASTASFASGCEEVAEQAPPVFTPIGDVQELMASLVEPQAEVYWDAVGVIVDEEGEHQLAPTNDEEWLLVLSAAYAVAEAGNLLLMPGYAVDDGGWVAMSQALVEVGRRAAEAAAVRDLDAVFDAGAEMYFACTNCHAAYAVGTLRPNDERVDGA